MDDWQVKFFHEQMCNEDSDIRIGACTVNGEESYVVMMKMAADTDNVWVKPIFVFVTPGMEIGGVSAHKVMCDSCDAPKEEPLSGESDEV